MLVKTRGLKGAALDWAVELIERDFVCCCVGDSDVPVLLGVIRKFSTEWEHGGPVIRRMGRVDLIQYEDKGYGDCDLFHGGRTMSVRGDDILVAAMRCRVLSIMGEEIVVPEPSALDLASAIHEVKRNDYE